MEKSVLSPSSLGEPIGPFVRGIRVGSLVAISGTSALSHQTGPMEQRSLDPDFGVQTRLTFENFHLALVDGGLDWEDVIKVTVMIKRREDYVEMNAIRAEILSDFTMASTTFVCELIRDDMLIELDGWATVPDVRK